MPAASAGTIAPLDVDAMQRAADRVVGEHDFSSFRAAECQAKTPVKTLRLARVRATGDLVRFDFSANAFLHHMIRNLVGALVYVGAGKHDDAWMQSLLEARDRRARRRRSPPTGSTSPVRTTTSASGTSGDAARSLLAG